MAAAFHLVRPVRRTTSVVFASPHSGRVVPPAFLRRAELDERAIRSSEDAFVDRLFDAAPREGAPLLAAVASRAFVDLNRAADELDPALIDGVRRPVHNPRVASGLGVIPRVVAGGRPIHRGRIGMAEAEARIEGIWRPYHEALEGLLLESHARFGEAILIDCHSMPHEAIEAVGPPARPRPTWCWATASAPRLPRRVVDRIEAPSTGRACGRAQHALRRRLSCSTTAGPRGASTRCRWRSTARST
jgi:N-formylglutamate amidohydrolase